MNLDKCFGKGVIIFGIIMFVIGIFNLYETNMGYTSMTLEHSMHIILLGYLIMSQRN